MVRKGGEKWDGGGEREIKGVCVRVIGCFIYCIVVWCVCVCVCACGACVYVRVCVGGLGAV